MFRPCVGLSPFHYGRAVDSVRTYFLSRYQPIQESVVTVIREGHGRIHSLIELQLLQRVAGLGSAGQDARKCPRHEPWARSSALCAQSSVPRRKYAGLLAGVCQRRRSSPSCGLNVWVALTFAREQAELEKRRSEKLRRRPNAFLIG